MVFTVGTITLAVQMFAFYGSSVLIALIAQNIMGYSAYQAGLMISSGAVMALFAMPTAGRLIAIVDNRILITFGALVSGYGMLMASHLNFESTFWQITMPRVLLGGGGFHGFGFR